MPPTQTHTLILGASAAGLSCAAQLDKRNIEYKILEKESQVANAWRNHYHRLHLHTNKGSSTLPFVKFPSDTPKYPTRKQVVAYLEKYSQSQEIEPFFNTEATNMSKSNGRWITQTNNGSFVSEHVIICTGNTNIPRLIPKPGLENFPGKIMHSSEYKNGMEFEGKKILVIGFGNSACEIVICLHEHGAKPAMSVRSPVNIIPRDILGIPVLALGIAQSALPPSFADKMNRPLLNLIVGNFEKYGLKKLPYGPIEQIVEHHQIPLLDIGTLALIRSGEILIFGDIEKIENSTIHFSDDISEAFDAIIMATGYETGLEKILELSLERKEDIQLNIKKRKHFGEDNLYFCGFYVAPTGMLREIKIESGVIADAIADS